MSDIVIPDFVKKHLMVKNRAILIILSVMLFFRMASSLFDFSIVRFLINRLGDGQYLLIGIFFTIAAALALVVDIPIGVLQDKIRPRYLLLAAVLFLLCSNLIFLFSTLTVVLGLLAVILYQMSLEIYFITTCTYIFRLSNKNNFAQNVAQGDVADNTGQVIGLVLGGLLFFVDSSMGYNYYIVIVLLLILIGFVFLFIYEFIDHKNYNSLEKYILKQKFAQENLAKVKQIEEEIIEDRDEEPETIMDNPNVNVWEEVKRKMPENFRFLFKIFTSPTRVPVLFWVVMIIIFTNFWNQCFFIFEPVYMAELYSDENSLITQNIPRYFFESIMMVVSIVVPTFVFEVPFGKLADLWGKDKIIIASHILGGVISFILSLYTTTWAFFAFYLVLGIAFVGIYPASTGLMNEAYADERKSESDEKNASLPMNTTVAPVQEKDNSEGESAALISFVMSCGTVFSGVLGALVLDYLNFQMIFLLLSSALVLVGVASWWFLATYNKKTPQSPEVTVAPAPQIPQQAPQA